MLANQRMKLTGAAILVLRGMQVLQAAPAAYPYRSQGEPTGGAMLEERLPPADAVYRVEDIKILPIPDTFFGLLDAIR